MNLVRPRQPRTRSLQTRSVHAGHLTPVNTIQFCAARKLTNDQLLSIAPPSWPRQQQPLEGTLPSAQLLRPTCCQSRACYNAASCSSALLGTWRAPFLPSALSEPRLPLAVLCQTLTPQMSLTLTRALLKVKSVEVRSFDCILGLPRSRIASRGPAHLSEFIFHACVLGETCGAHTLLRHGQDFKLTSEPQHVRDAAVSSTCCIPRMLADSFPGLVGWWMDPSVSTAQAAYDVFLASLQRHKVVSELQRFSCLCHEDAAPL